MKIGILKSMKGGSKIIFWTIFFKSIFLIVLAMGKSLLLFEFVKKLYSWDALLGTRRSNLYTWRMILDTYDGL